MPAELFDDVGATSEVLDHVDARAAASRTRKFPGWMLVTICAIAGVLAVGLRPSATVADWLAAISVAAGGLACALAVASKLPGVADARTGAPET